MCVHVCVCVHMCVCMCVRMRVCVCVCARARARMQEDSMRTGSSEEPRLQDPMKVVHKEQDIITSFAINQVSLTHTQTYGHAHTHTRMHARTHACTHIHLHTHTHTHTNTHREIIAFLQQTKQCVCICHFL